MQNAFGKLSPAFFERRSIRRYTDQPVPRELITTILEAAIWSPSAHNRQPWRFAVIIEAERKEALARAMGAKLRHDLEADGVPEEKIAADTARSYGRITGAPAAVVLCLTMADMDGYPDSRRAQNEYLMAVQSAAMAGQNLLLAAHEVGLGGCWMCAPLFSPEVVRAALELPDDWQPQALIALGYPSESRTSTRIPLEECVLWR